jgi:hypothetical protein
MMSKKSMQWVKSIHLKQILSFRPDLRTAAIAAGVLFVAVAMLIASREPASAPSKAAPIASPSPVPDLHAKDREALASKSLSTSAVPAPPSFTVEPAEKQPAQKVAVITGCLERDDQTFRLKNTSGADAPRSRSWKTGFLKKGNASIAVIDGSNRFKLTNHVGERVSVTGTLVDREMQLRSLQRIAPSCRQPSASSN